MNFIWLRERRGSVSGIPPLGESLTYIQIKPHWAHPPPGGSDQIKPQWDVHPLGGLEERVREQYIS